MKPEELSIKVSDLVENYLDDADRGVYALDGRVVVRPAYQREFVYQKKQRNLVIDSVLKGLPLGIFYWATCHDGKHPYEILDGQQRTISLCQYCTNQFTVPIPNVDGKADEKMYMNLPADQKAIIDDYKLIVYVFDGTEKEKLDWFQRINVAGVLMTEQELLNAAYTGPWLTDAKLHFSKPNCAAELMGEHYVKGSPIRQDLLGKALDWACTRDGLRQRSDYMALHQMDADADDLWQHYQDVLNWAKKLFPYWKAKITDCQDWGTLWAEHHDEQYNANTLEGEIEELLLDDDVQNHAGIIPYLLEHRTLKAERHLSLRAFSPAQKQRAYAAQDGMCAICGEHFELDQMEADHVTPWSQGGHTTDDNLQMLCRDCNRRKSNR